MLDHGGDVVAVQRFAPAFTALQAADGRPRHARGEQRVFAKPSSIRPKRGSVWTSMLANRSAAR